MPKNLKIKIGSRVRTLRAARKITQERLAHSIERTPEAVSNIERGKSLPGLDTLERIARHLDLPLADFFSDDAPRKDSRRLEIEARLQYLLSSLSDSNAEIALDQVEVLVSRKGKRGEGR